MSTTWYTLTDPASPDPNELARIGEDWLEAPEDQPRLLSMLLNAARDQVLDYGPKLGEDEDIPERFVLAQLMQAKNLAMAGEVQSSGDYGDAGFSFTPRPLDKTVRGVIRPQDGGPDAY